MTAETLKPFITPPTVDIFPTSLSSSKRRLFKSNFLDVGLSVTAVILTTVLLVLTIWALVRVATLETEVGRMRMAVENIQNRLGPHYLDDWDAFEKKYKNAIIDKDPSSEEDDSHETRNEENKDESDQYDEIGNYHDLLTKVNSYDNESDGDNDEDSYISEDDNLYDDFEKYQDSKKIRSRQTRSIAPVLNRFSLHKETIKSELNKTEGTTPMLLKPVTPESVSTVHPVTSITSPQSVVKTNHKRNIVADNLDKRRSPLRPRFNRRHKIRVTKSAKYTRPRNSMSFARGAHFHLVRKVSERFAALKVDSYPGDMYIGHPSWSHETSIEQNFKVDNGLLTVREPGLYYIYAQVCYNNTHDQNGFVIFHGHKPFLQCLNTVPTNMPLKIHTCHTSGLIHLRANETLHLRDFHSDRNVILKDTNNRSYFGLIKI